MKEKLRILSNFGLILGQIVLLFFSRDLGLVLMICSSLMSFPYFLEQKMWDVLILMGFMFVVNVTGLIIQ